MLEVYGTVDEKGLFKKLGGMAAGAALASACTVGEPCPPQIGKPPPATEIDVPQVFLDPSSQANDMDQDGDGFPDDFCDQLPDNGPCSLACDPQALSDQYGVPGACVNFRCELDSGEEFGVHTCTPPTTESVASVRRLFLMEDSRKNIERLLKLPKNVQDIFHEVSDKHSFPLAKAFVLWAKEHGAGHDQIGGHAVDEPFQNVPRKGPPMLDPANLARLNRNSPDIKQYMREVGYGLLDALDARVNVMPGLVNKASSLQDVTAAMAKFQKRAEGDDKVMVKMPDGFYWVRLDSCEHAREGEEMQHCATDSRGNLVSFRDPKGHPHVTMTYNAGNNSVFQIKGKQNREPERKYWPGIEAFFEKTKAKLKDRYISDELKGLLSAHTQRVAILQTGDGMVWIELSDGFYGLVPEQGWEQAKASDAIITCSGEEYRENQIKEISINQEMTAKEFLGHLVPFMKKLGSKLDVSKVPHDKLTKSGESLNAELAQLKDASLLVYKDRQIKIADPEGPVVAKVGSERKLFADLTRFFEMDAVGTLVGVHTTEGMLISEFKGDASKLAALDGPALTKALNVGSVYGFEAKSVVNPGNKPMGQVIPQTFATEEVSSE